MREKGFDLHLILKCNLRSVKERSTGSFHEQQLLIEAIVCSATHDFKKYIYTDLF